MIKKHFNKIIALGIVATSVLVFNPTGANAEWKQDSTGWWYTEGDSWDTGWRNIGGEWYYFKDDGYMFNSPYCYFNNNVGSYVGARYIESNGEVYYFDKDGHMLHDCFIVQGSGGYQSWLKSDGTQDDKFYGNKYNGNYDLSQVK